ncbi:MAG: hypothetical protein QN120_09235 [Armatimonadota bacterium]|nr:hypothetical protein [Armatimonadota bacterium]
MLNRLNVSITGMLAGSHARYVPTWMEVQITLAIVAAGLLAYRWAVEHLPVFEAASRPVATAPARDRPAGAPAPAGIRAYSARTWTRLGGIST